MHQWFRDLELPEWLVSPEELGDSGEPKRAEGAKTPEGESKRKVHRVGDAEDLPDATRAAEKGSSRKLQSFARVAYKS